MDKRVKTPARAGQRFNAHGREHLAHQREVDRVVQRKGGNGGRERRPVEDAEMFFGLKWERLDPVLREGGG